MGFIVLLSISALFTVSLYNNALNTLLGIPFGIVFFIVAIPFMIISTIFRAIGIDFFYTKGILAEMGILLGILLTIFWAYFLSCLLISVYDKFKNRKFHILMLDP